MWQYSYIVASPSKIALLVHTEGLGWFVSLSSANCCELFSFAATD